MSPVGDMVVEDTATADSPHIAHKKSRTRSRKALAEIDDLGADGLNATPPVTAATSEGDGARSRTGASAER